MGDVLGWCLVLMATVVPWGLFPPDLHFPRLKLEHRADRLRAAEQCENPYQGWTKLLKLEASLPSGPHPPRPLSAHPMLT